LGSYKLQDLTRSTLIEFGKKRAKAGAGRATLAVDLSFNGTLLTHAAAVHGISVSPEEVKLARVALTRLGLVGRSNERDWRPTQPELDALNTYFEEKPRQLLPMHRIIQFAVATAMRLEEIFSITWDDLDMRSRMVIVRNRNNQRETTNVCPCSVLQALKLRKSSLSNASSHVAKGACSHTTTNLPEQLFTGLARC
jgi:integrase